MSFTKAEVKEQITNLTQQEKQMWANLNFLLGQKSTLEALLPEMPDDPEPVFPDPGPEVGDPPSICDPERILAAIPDPV
jgi:hypothetical protein